tara:strand:- start:1843 stop:2055 length:213 start_codon:yes stop_codon:yes gene_type:complete
MDNIILTVEYKNVYGNELVYPVNAKAKAIARLAGSKTLTPQAIQIAKELGFIIEEEGQFQSIPVVGRKVI